MTDIRTVLNAAADDFDRLADTLDRWAAESRSGGWSTHQVDANTHEANNCRRRASSLRAHAKNARNGEEPYVPPHLRFKNSHLPTP